MGLGDGPGEWDDYEWVRLADLPASPPPAPPPVRRAGPPALADAVLTRLARRSLWTTGGTLLASDVDQTIQERSGCDDQSLAAKTATILELETANPA